MGVYIKDQTGLKRIDGGGSGGGSGVSSEALSKHENNHYIHLQEDNTGELNIVDDKGYIIAKVDAEGLNAKNVKVDGKPVSEMIAEAVGSGGGGGSGSTTVVTKESLGLGKVDNTADKDKPVSTPQQTALDNLKKEVSEAIDSDSDVFHIADKNGNIVATIDKNGLNAVELMVKGVKVSDMGGSGGATKYTDVYIAYSKVWGELDDTIGNACYLLQCRLSGRVDIENYGDLVAYLTEKGYTNRDVTYPVTGFMTYNKTPQIPIGIYVKNGLLYCLVVMGSNSSNVNKSNFIEFYAIEAGLTITSKHVVV